MKAFVLLVALAALLGGCGKTIVVCDTRAGGGESGLRRLDVFFAKTRRHELERFPHRLETRAGLVARPHGIFICLARDSTVAHQRRTPFDQMSGIGQGRLALGNVGTRLCDFLRPRPTGEFPHIGFAGREFGARHI